MTHEFQSDIDAIDRIGAVPTILDVVCRTTGMGFAAVARVTEDRWIACSVLDKIAFGLTPGGELQVTTTICNEIRQTGEAVIIDHVAEDAGFVSHATPALYGFQSYISMPIVRKDGSFFGTLCAIDPRPARLKNPETIGMFKLFAELIAAHLDSNQALATSEASLTSERRTAELRDQFIAVLGHDLRNPLASIGAGANMLTRMRLEEKAAVIVGHMQHSVARMSALIDNVLDFARGRLGGGVTVRKDSDEPLEPILRQTIDELRAVHPDREIDVRFAFAGPIAADRGRIARLLSNLVANALVHGARDGIVRVDATSDDDTFRLSVANTGDPIPPEAMARLFEPFYRSSSASAGGLGLGLYIGTEIARAHGGTLTVTSSPQETRFILEMPVT